jgi:PQQ-dependent dehydrogenase (methanol/ethanol family)
MLLVPWALTAAACGDARPPADARTEPARPAVADPVDTTAPGGTTDAAEGEWVRSARDYEGTRFSPLRQITTANAESLQVAWTFSTGVNRGQEAAPIVAGTTMYVVTPFPNLIYALDLTNPGTVKWQYDPKPDPSALGVACCDWVNRGAAFADGRVFYNTLDNHTVALDAGTGRELWKVRLGDYNVGESMTMAPLVVKGKVLVGVSGGEFGVRGWLTALDAESGSVAWRAYSTGPDADVLIGDRFTPHYDSERGEDLGVTTWPPSAWQTGGGTVWGFVSYDPELDLIYYGTGNPGPWNPTVRPGDNKWTAGIFARDPDDGQAVWFYQTSPHDQFDHDGINESVLVDLPLGGTMRKVLLHPGRTGYMYTIDRTTGEVLSAPPFGLVTASQGVDLATGRLLPNPDKAPRMGRVVRMICPAASGMKDWQPSAWSPRTRLLYVPHQNLCMDYEGTEANYIAGTPYIGTEHKFYAGPGGLMGRFTAWDPVAGRAVWQIEERFPVWSGALVTAGDVVFYGTMDGFFKALDARTGRELWRFKAGSGIIGQPVSYTGPDGRQYVAVLSGIGGWPGAIVAAGLDTRDSTAGGGWGAAMRELPGATTPGGTLYVFALP